VCLVIEHRGRKRQTKYTSKRDGACDAAVQTGVAGLQFHPIPKTAASLGLLSVHEPVHEEVTVLNDDCARYGPTSFSTTSLAQQQATAASIESPRQGISFEQTQRQFQPSMGARRLYWLPRVSYPKPTASFDSVLSRLTARTILFGGRLHLHLYGS
jgi:hypothetical protein